MVKMVGLWLYYDTTDDDGKIMEDCRRLYCKHLPSVQDDTLLFKKFLADVRKILHVRHNDRIYLFSRTKDQTPINDFQTLVRHLNDHAKLSVRVL
jgi:hypothetical protein